MAKQQTAAPKKAAETPKSVFAKPSPQPEAGSAAPAVEGDADFAVGDGEEDEITASATTATAPAPADGVAPAVAPVPAAPIAPAKPDAPARAAKAPAQPKPRAAKREEDEIDGPLPTQGEIDAENAKRLAASQAEGVKHSEHLTRLSKLQGEVAAGLRLKKLATKEPHLAALFREVEAALKSDDEELRATVADKLTKLISRR